ncbi:MAG: Crp/Fnr family transcriptional regulator [Veillonellales bacterium]
MDEKWIPVLSESLLFAGIAPNTLKAMLVCLQPQVYSYHKNSYIAMMGESFAGVGILLSGKAPVIKESVTGKRVVISMLQTGDLFGEMAAFSSRKVWPASVYAKTDCRALFLPVDKMVESCSHNCGGHRALIYNMLRIISDRAVMLNRRIEYFSMKSLREKISTYLLEQYQWRGKEIFELPLNRSELSGFLNVSRESLSREMCRMRDEGSIDFYQSSVRIKNLAALKETAEG